MLDLDQIKELNK